MLLTLTNPVENVTHVTLAACEEEDPDDINSTAKVFNYTFSFLFVEINCSHGKFQVVDIYCTNTHYCPNYRQTLTL